MTLRVPFLVLGALVALLGACTDNGGAAPRGPTDPAPAVDILKIAFLADFSLPEATEMVLPASQAALLALAEEEGRDRLPMDVKIEQHDTGGDLTVALKTARELAADPEVVGVVIAPFTQQFRQVGDVLDAAGMATVNLSTLGPELSTYGWTNWRRAVPAQAVQASALARFTSELPAAHRGLCLAGDPTPSSRELLRLVEVAAEGRDVESHLTVLRGVLSAAATAEEIVEDGCGVLVWTGFGEPAAALRSLLAAGEERGPSLVAADAAKSEAFLAEAGEAGSGTVVACPCVDFTTSTRLDAQRFISSFQFQVGPSPGVYAVEGYDVARMFLVVVREGAATRQEVAAAMFETTTFEGLGGRYAFGENGELVRGASVVRLFRAETGRWIPVGAREA